MNNITIDSDSDIAQDIISCAEDNRLEPYYNYSGRAMYGKKCFGLVGSIGSIAGFIIDMVESCTMEEVVSLPFTTKQTVIECFRYMHTDSMGMDSIMYFPSLNIEAPKESDE